MSIPVCKFYNTNRKCAFGKHCRFLHCASPGPPFKPDLRSKHNEEYLDSPHSLSTQTISVKHTGLNSIGNEGSVSLKSTSISQTQKEPHQDNTDNSQDEYSSVQLARERLTSLSKSVNKTVCFYFKTYGNCRNGRNCKFSHNISDSQQSSKHNGPIKQQKSVRILAEIPPRFRKTEEQEETGIESTHSDAGKDMRSRNSRNNDHKQIKRSLTNETTLTIPERRVCRFFKVGYCSKGDYCKFLHLSDDGSEVKATKSNLNKPDYENEKIHNDGSKDANQEGKSSSEVCENITKTRPEHAYRPSSKSSSQPFLMKQSFSYAELENVDIKAVRDSEINTIKKRFPRDKITILEDTENKFSAKILFTPTDPDWAFDVHVFELQIVIPSNYPREMMNVALPGDQNLPETIRRYVEISIKEWLDQKVEQLASRNKVELIFRPFLLWLDRNLEDITMEALKQWKRELVAKAAGMEFIPAVKLQEKFKIQSELGSDEEEKNKSETDDESELGSDETEGSCDDSENDMDEIIQNQNFNPERKGTEIELRHLQLLENASALMFEKLKLVLQCGRCKNHSDLLVPPGKVMSIQCEKCNQKQFVHFRTSLAHQFSSVVGYLDLDGCQAFDLIFQDCNVVVTCMACSKQTCINGFVSGHVVDAWCRACNARFKLATEAVKFSQLVPSSVDTSVHNLVEVTSSKQKRLPKDPAIKEGFPLPEFGTCKHYKHSYRWLRFPCCGKAYPCDICHDKKEDHEMIYATRMICGHCCREQNFSATRPCSSCGLHLTKIRTAHWEGGSGCRDKISMSKSDQQKYKNSNKTMSNHKKKNQAGSSKKVTKLRHM